MTHGHPVLATCATFAILLPTVSQRVFNVTSSSMSSDLLFRTTSEFSECSLNRCALSFMQRKMTVVHNSSAQQSSFLHHQLVIAHNRSFQQSHVPHKLQVRKLIPEVQHSVVAQEVESEWDSIKAETAAAKRNSTVHAAAAMTNSSRKYDTLAMFVAGVSSSGALVTELSNLIALCSTDEFNWPTHIFGEPRSRHPNGLWGIHDKVDWTVLAFSTILLIVLDFSVLRPWFESTSMRGLYRTMPVLVAWVFAGLLFNCYIGWRHGFHDAVSWFNGYLLEWLLSMDNIFVFHLVFKLYKTPEHLLSKALFWGVGGAILCRMIFFVTLNSLLNVVHWFYYVFGAFLIYSGFQAAHDGEDEDELADSWVVRSLRWLLDGFLMPAPHYDMEGRLIIWTKDKAGHASTIQISMLVPVIICLELTDIFFAVDSVSAKVGQIPDQFVAYSSSVFAMFGLRALFFIIEDLVHRLRFLKYGLCFILIFIGAELMLANVVDLPATVVCIVLTSVFTFCVGLSVLIPESKEEEPVSESC